MPWAFLERSIQFVSSRAHPIHLTAFPSFRCTSEITFPLCTVLMCHVSWCRQQRSSSKSSIWWKFVEWTLWAFCQNSNNDTPILKYQLAFRFQFSLQLTTGTSNRQTEGKIVTTTIWFGLNAVLVASPHFYSFDLCFSISASLCWVVCRSIWFGIVFVENWRGVWALFIERDTFRDKKVPILQCPILWSRILVCRVFKHWNSTRNIITNFTEWIESIKCMCIQDINFRIGVRPFSEKGSYRQMNKCLARIEILSILSACRPAHLVHI